MQLYSKGYKITFCAGPNPFCVLPEVRDEWEPSVMVLAGNKVGHTFIGQPFHKQIIEIIDKSLTGFYMGTIEVNGFMEG